MTEANLYALLRAASGLSQGEAARFHDVRPQAVRDWEAGRRAPRPGVIREIAGLVCQILDGALQSVEYLEKRLDAAARSGDGAPETAVLGIAHDDGDAARLGLPTASAHARMVAIVAAALIEDGLQIDVGPRGASALTAGAVAIHKK